MADVHEQDETLAENEQLRPSDFKNINREGFKEALTSQEDYSSPVDTHNAQPAVTEAQDADSSHNSPPVPKHLDL